MLTIPKIEPININDYDYPLTDSHIAKFPVQNRDQSKLLVYNKGQILNAEFKNIADYLPEKSHLVFNNTKVIPARFIVKNKNGANIEILLLKPVGHTYEQIFNQSKSVTWQCIIGNKKRWKQSETLTLALNQSNVNFKIFISYSDFNENLVEFYWEANSIHFLDIINKIGEMPLPPYLNRKSEFSDLSTYQTIYSEKNGAIAAPTAGLHFTENTFKSLKSKEISHQFTTLHVGAGTFLPVKTQNAIEHKMHNEQIIFNKLSIENLLEKIEYIIPVGTTSLRALESLYWFGVKLSDHFHSESKHFFIEKLYPYSNVNNISTKKSLENILNYMVKNNLEEIVGETEILIFPGYKFQICKGLVTNFHQPKSTLLLLVSALIGSDWHKLYQTALENNYKFLSYGDSSLLLP